MPAPLSPDVLARLRDAVGADHVLTSGIEPYAHDETEDFEFPPDAVVRPGSTAEVAAVLRIASERRIPVTPQAARTSLSGGALCVHGGIALSMERMARIKDIDEGNLFCVVEPGVITQALQEEVEKRGLFYGPDPASRGSCTIGGNIAHNAGGPRALKYGVTKDWVTGLEAVIPSGEILRTGGKLMKNVAGYNLTQLLVGSEGTLAVVTEATLKLLPKPAFARTLLAPFGDVVSAARAVTEIFKARIVPCACEYMERAAVEAAERRKGVKLPVSGEAVLLIEVDGNDESQLDRDAERIAEICMAAGAPDVFPADDPEKRKFVWDLRRSIGEAVKAISAYKEEDTVVPRMRLPELVQAVREVTKKHGLTAISYGHVGDGNLHVNILRGDLGEEAWRRGIEPAVRELFERTVAMGGQITGEHGVGYVQKNYMPIAFPKHHIELLRSVKKVFDPLGILNPGKIFPDP
ncbi:MAG TPA: FAD-linked oxidase C-terminal domain-containing protein [Planctomycetota bacterium]|nr:FAD-linked oxidase C-terminal domain-containing protein [Planctomycetota bacterium]